MTDAANNTITYDYDSIGNLVTTTDPRGNTINNGYDIRGRKIAMSDPDMGAWSYAYNAFGELVSQTDAKGQVTTMQYDALGRMTARTDLAGTDIAQVSTWTYDTGAGKGIGKLAVMSGGANTSQTFTYDALGRVQSSTYSIMGQTFTVAQSYDSAGRLDTLTYPVSTAYPTGLQVQRSYQNGFLKQVKNPVTGAMFWQADARTERGQVNSEALGNGLLTFRDYSASNGWMREVKTSNVFSQALQHSDYHFDQVGNLARRSDLRAGGVTENFSYDALDRLTGSSFTNAPAGGGYTNKTYAYDALGNITSKSDVGAYTYGACNAGPHAVCSAGGVNYAYDANGNMTSGDGREMAYTAFNKPFYLTQNNNHVYYLYGPDRNRVYKEAFGATYDRTTYFVGLGDTGGTLFEREVENGSTLTTDKYFIYADAREPVAQIVAKGGTTANEYFHRDHLGSVEVITDSFGSLVNNSSFDAWGLRRGNDWKDMSGGQYSMPLRDLTVTNHENIAEVGLIHMNGARLRPAARPLPERRPEHRSALQPAELQPLQLRDEQPAAQ